MPHTETVVISTALESGTTSSPSQFLAHTPMHTVTSTTHSLETSSFVAVIAVMSMIIVIIGVVAVTTIVILFMKWRQSKVNNCNRGALENIFT